MGEARRKNQNRVKLKLIRYRNVWGIRLLSRNVHFALRQERFEGRRNRHGIDKGETTLNK
jgi:hypothetical protein